MGLKSIAIIGGGISGLAALHFLNKRFEGKALITLYEAASHTGGNIQTSTQDGFCFENGPNGFLAHPATLQLIKDIGLSGQLIEAAKENKRRYIQVNGRLHQIPTGFMSFLGTPLLSGDGKWEVIKGVFRRRVSRDRSIYEYAAARFGREAAEGLFDPFISGIFAGNSKRLHMASVFPNIKPKPRARLYSLKEGMGQLIKALQERYNLQIKTGYPVNSLQQLQADKIICTIPAYAAQPVFAGTHLALAQALARVPYAPLVVVGLAFEAKIFRTKPTGFGYLIPSNQRKEILGVLLDSNCFEGRAPQGSVIVRVMMGGVNSPRIINESSEVLKEKAMRELDQIYGLKQNALHYWVKRWPLAIPQYEMDYPQIAAVIRSETAQIPNLTLSGNYLNGISLNDCVNNAKSIAQSLAL